MAKGKRNDAEQAWNTTMMLDYAIEHYGLQVPNDPRAGSDTREAWRRKMQRALRDMGRDTKHGGREHSLPAQDAKRFIEVDMLGYFEEWATKEDAVRDAHRLVEAEAEDANYAEIMARQADFYEEWAKEAEEMEPSSLDIDKMRHKELRFMLQAVIYEVSGGKKRFDVESFEADYRELNDLGRFDHYELEPPSRVRKWQLRDRLADPIDSYLKPIADGPGRQKP